MAGPGSRRHAQRLPGAVVEAATRRAAALRPHVQHEQELRSHAEQRVDGLSRRQVARLAPLAAAQADLTTHAVSAVTLRARLSGLEATAAAPVPGQPAEDATCGLLLREATTAATRASHELSGMQAMLQSSATGTASDVASGLDLVHSLVRNELIVAMTRALTKAQVAMDVLAAELDDLSAALPCAPSLDTDLRLFDRWFDNFFTDWALPHRLPAAMGVVRACQGEVAVVAERLDSLHADLALRQEEVKAAAARPASRVVTRAS